MLEEKGWKRNKPVIQFGNSYLISDKNDVQYYWAIKNHNSFSIVLCITSAELNFVMCYKGLLLMHNFRIFLKWNRVSISLSLSLSLSLYHRLIIEKIQEKMKKKRTSECKWVFHSLFHHTKRKEETIWSFTFMAWRRCLFGLIFPGNIRCFM
jgi:hypothetical protein